ncbi:hypothetical protein KKB83_01495 [Patescibacteria group bacterium]|nr:hypothetical protein [Patescibacteria group bacterium]
MHEKLAPKTTETQTASYSPEQGELLQSREDAEKFPKGIDIFHETLIDSTDEVQRREIYPGLAPHVYVSTNEFVAVAEAFSVHLPPGLQAHPGEEISPGRRATLPKHATFVVYRARVEAQSLHPDDEDTGHYDPQRPAYNWIIPKIESDKILSAKKVKVTHADGKVQVETLEEVSEFEYLC